MLGRGTRRRRPRWWNTPPRRPRPASPRPGATPRPPSARSAGRPTAGAASGASCSFRPPWPPWRAWPPSPVTKPRRPPPSARHAPSSAAAARRSPPPRSATPRASWPGTGRARPTPSTWPARPPCSGTGAVTGWTPATASSCSACSPRPASATPTRPACWPPRTRPGGRCSTWPPDSPPTAAPPNTPSARPGTSSAMTASPRPGTEGQPLTLDDAVAYATRKGGGRKRPATGWASLTPAEREVVRLGRRRPAERGHRPAAVHRPRHRQSAPVPHLRQARHHHPHRTSRTGSRTGSDRQMT